MNGDKSVTITRPYTSGLPNGTYTVRMEVADTNAITATANNQGTFTFIKGPNPQMQTGLSNGGFTNVSISYTP